MGSARDRSDHGARPADRNRRTNQPVSSGGKHNAGGGAQHGEMDTRPVIVIREDLVGVTDEALAAVVALADNGLYVRGRLLVQVGSSEPVKRVPWLRRSIGAPVVVPVEAESILDRLDHAACFLKESRTGLVPARPPVWVARQIMARLTWPLPLLEWVTEAPTLRPDGTVLDTPGYDEATGVLYRPSVEYPRVPSTRSAADVDQALKSLVDPLAEFPFVDTSAKAAAVAAVLTVIARSAITGPVPAFAIRSPAPGTGKGLLAALIGICGTGRAPALMTHTAEREELRKRILAIAMGGVPVVQLDNLSGSVGSDELAAALTATEFSDRLLGVNKVVQAPLRMVWLMTGNNITFKRTLGRRVIPIDLDARVEHPEDRHGFLYDDVASVVKSRHPMLVAAGLTLLRAYVEAGAPRHGKPRMGSFEAWDDLIRGACVWLGLSDPAASDDPGTARGRIRIESDDDLEALGDLLEAMEQAFGVETFTATELENRAITDSSLMSALQATSANRGRVTAASIGYTLRGARDRIVRGLKLLKAPGPAKHTGSRWRVEGRSSPGTTGTMGEDPPSQTRVDLQDNIVHFGSAAGIGPNDPHRPPELCNVHSLGGNGAGA